MNKKTALLIALIFFATFFTCINVSAEEIETSSSVIYANPGDNLNEMIAGLKPGDKLLLHEGKYEGSFVIDSDVKGTSKKYITIGSAPGEKAVLTGENLGGGTVLMTMSGCEYVHIENLTFCNVSGNNACGILVESGTKHFKISGNEFHDIRCEGKDSANAIFCSEKVRTSLFPVEALKEIMSMTLQQDTEKLSALQATYIR